MRVATRTTAHMVWEQGRSHSHQLGPCWGGCPTWHAHGPLTRSPFQLLPLSSPASSSVATPAAAACLSLCRLHLHLHLRAAGGTLFAALPAPPCHSPRFSSVSPQGELVLYCLPARPPWPAFMSVGGSGPALALPFSQTSLRFSNRVLRCQLPACKSCISQASCGGPGVAPNAGRCWQATSSHSTAATLGTLSPALPCGCCTMTPAMPAAGAQP